MSIDQPFSFNRIYKGAPVEGMVFTSTAALNAYLTSPVRYAGQVVTLVEGGVVTLYKLSADETTWEESGGSTDPTVLTRLRNMLSTGVLTGGDMTVFSGTQITIQAGTGIVVDNTDPANPTYTEVSWVTQNFTVDTSGNAQYIYIDAAGATHDQPTEFTSQDHRDKIILGVVNTIGGNVNTTSNIVLPQTNVANIVKDLSDSIGIINTEGNIIGPDPINLPLGLTKTAGKVFEMGANYLSNVKDPSNVVTPSFFTNDAGKAFSEFYSDGSGGISFVAPSGNIDPTVWDDDSGTLQTVNSNNWSVKRVYLGPISNTLFVTVGRAEYNNLNEAKEQFQTETVILPETPGTLILIGYVFVRGGATDLNLAGDALFIPANKFGTGVGAGASAINNTQQETYDNSPDGGITLDAAVGVKAIRDNAVPLTGNLLEVTDNGDTTKYFESSAERAAVTDRDGRQVIRKESDVFYIEDFKENNPTDVITVTGTWTLENETVATQDGSYQAAKLTQAVGSLGATADIRGIALNDKAKTFLMGLFADINYNGNPDDIFLEVIKSDDNITYTTHTTLTINKVGRLELAQLNYQLEGISDSATHIGLRFRVNTENDGAVLIFNNVKLQYNPDNISEFVQEETITYSGFTNRDVSNFILLSTEKTNDSRSLVQVTNTLQTRYTFKARCTFTSTLSYAASAETAVELRLYDENDVLKFSSAEETDNIGQCSATLQGLAESGDYLVYYATNNAADNVSNNFSVTATKKSSNVIFQGVNSQAEWQDWTPTTQGIGTPTNINARYRRDGGSFKGIVSLDGGAVDGSEFRLGLPDGLVISSKITNYQIAGQFGRGSATGAGVNKMVIANGGNSYINISNQIGGAETPIAGNSVIANGEGIILTIDVEIEGWDGNPIAAIPVTDLVENVFSARIANNGTASITSENSKFIQSVNRTDTGKVTVNLLPGFFTVIPAMDATPTGATDLNDRKATIPRDTITANSFEVTVSDANGIFRDEDFSVTVIRQGSDYKAPQSHFLSNAPLHRIGYVVDSKPPASDGGDFVTGDWRTRDLTATSGDFGLFGTLNANQFTLVPGTYEIDGSAPAFAVNLHQAKIRNITDSVDEITGTSDFVHPTNTSTARSFVKGILKVVGTPKTFELQHRCNQTQLTDGFGRGTNYGLNAIFSELKITKIL